MTKKIFVIFFAVFSCLITLNVSVNTAEGGELVTNGDFSNGMTNWYPWTYEGGGRTASFNVVNGELVISSINSGGVADWVTVLNSPVSLTQGKTYNITFDAKSTASKTISVGPREGFGDYVPYSMQQFAIDTVMKTHTFKYTHNAASDAESQFIFYLGATDHPVYIDNLSVEEATPEPPPEPPTGDTIKLLSIGDSITQGNIYGAGTYRKPLYYDLTQAGYNVDFVGSHDNMAASSATDGSPDTDTGWDQDNEAWWGYSTGQLENILTNTVTTYDFDIALIHLGTNDPNDAGIQNLKDIIDILRTDNPNVVIFLAQLIAPNYNNTYIPAFNQKIPGIVSEKNTADSPVILVNQYSTLTPGTSDYVDGLHPSTSGAAKMADVWFNAIIANFQLVEPNDELIVAEGYNITLGQTELVPNPSPDGVPIYPWFPDGHISYLPDTTPGQYQMYWSGSASYRTTGTSLMDQEYTSGIPAPPPALPKGSAGAFDNGGAWLMSVFRQSGNNMIGFFHGEDHEFASGNNPGGIAWKSIAVSTSSDNGVTWTKGGQIITSAKPKPGTPTWGGNGDHSIVYDEVNSRWVCYYQDNFLYMAVSYDPNGAPGTWKKYYNGSFSEDGLGGLESPVPGLESLPGGNPSVHFNTYLNQWVIVWHSWQSPDGNIWLSTSTDMIHWRKPVAIAVATGSEKMWYPSIIGITDVEAGQEAWLCYAYWPDANKEQRQFIRRKITFQLLEMPQSPLGLTASVGADSVSLDWADNAEADLSHYTVYRRISSNSTYEVIKIITGNQATSEFVDNNITDGTIYQYVVTATDTDGNESAYSDEVTANRAILSNIVTNGNLSNGLNNWYTWTYEGGGRTASFNVVNEELVVSNINGGGVADWITILNGPVSLTQGKTYVISFEARSTAPRTISVGPRKGFGDYAAYMMRSKLIGTTMKSYSFTYTHTAESDPNAQLIFFLGATDDTVYIDNLTMGEKISQPQIGPSLKLLTVGDSITQGNIFGAGTYRKSLYYEMMDAGYTVDFIGSHDNLAGQSGPTDGSPDSDTGWDQDNEAWWGYTTGQLESIITNNISIYDFDVVLIHLGTNDPNDGGIQNIKDIIDILRTDNPNVVIFLAQLIAPDAPNTNIPNFNNKIPGIVAEKTTDQSPVILVNQYNTLTPGSSDYVDSLHPSTSGATKMAAVWLDALNEYYLTAPTTYTLADVIRALQVAAGVPTTDAHAQADISGDGRIGLEEAIHALQVISRESIPEQ